MFGSGEEIYQFKDYMTLARWQKQYANSKINYRLGPFDGLLIHLFKNFKQA